MTWLITPYSLAAGRHLLLSLLALRHHRTGALVGAIGVATTIAGGRVAVQARRRSSSRRASPS